MLKSGNRPLIRLARIVLPVPGAISSATEAIKSGRKIIVAKDNEDEVGLINGEGCLIADHL
ncbi:hypothetical protein ACSLNR_24730, partial [Escherichia coli]